MSQMEDYDIDLGSAEAANALGGFEPIPSDDYLARVIVKELGASKNGYPQVTQEMQVVEGPYTGRTVREWVVFGPKSAPFIKARFIGLGLALPKGSLKAAALAEFYAREATGKLAWITVGQDERGDKVYNTVLNIRRYSTGSTFGNSQQDAATVSERELEEAPF